MRIRIRTAIRIEAKTPTEKPPKYRPIIVQIAEYVQTMGKKGKNSFRVMCHVVKYRPLSTLSTLSIVVLVDDENEMFP